MNRSNCCKLQAMVSSHTRAKETLQLGGKKVSITPSLSCARSSGN